MLIYKWKGGKWAGCLATGDASDVALMCRDLDSTESDIEYRTPDGALISYWVDEETGRIYGRPGPEDEKALLDKLARIAPGVVLRTADIAEEAPARP